MSVIQRPKMSLQVPVLCRTMEVGAAKSHCQTSDLYDWPAALLCFTHRNGRCGVVMDDDDISNVLENGAWHDLDRVFLNLLPDDLRREMYAGSARCLENPITREEGMRALATLHLQTNGNRLRRVGSDFASRRERNRQATEAFDTIWRRAERTALDLLSQDNFDTRRLVSVSGAYEWRDEPSEAWRLRCIWIRRQDFPLGEWLSHATVSPISERGRQNDRSFFLKSVQIRYRATDEVADVTVKLKKGAPEKLETTLAKKIAREWLLDNGEDLKAERGKQAQCEEYVESALAAKGLTLSKSTVRAIVTRTAKEISDEKKASMVKK